MWRQYDLRRLGVVYDQPLEKQETASGAYIPEMFGSAVGELVYAYTGAAWDQYDVFAAVAAQEYVMMQRAVELIDAYDLRPVYAVNLYCQCMQHRAIESVGVYIYIFCAGGIFGWFHAADNEWRRIDVDQVVGTAKGKFTRGASMIKATYRHMLCPHVGYAVPGYELCCCGGDSRMSMWKFARIHPKSKGHSSPPYITQWAQYTTSPIVWGWGGI